MCWGIDRKKIAKFLTIERTLSVWQIIYTSVAIAALFSFGFFLNTNDDRNILPLLLLPVLPYFMILLLQASAPWTGRSRFEQFKQRLRQYFSTFEAAVCNKLHPFKFEYTQLLSLLVAYVFLSYILFLNIDDVFHGNASPLGLLALLAVVIGKTLLIYNTADALSITHEYKNRIMPLFVALPLADVAGYLLNTPTVTSKIMIMVTQKQIPIDLSWVWSVLKNALGLPPSVWAILLPFLAVFFSRRHNAELDGRSNNFLKDGVSAVFLSFLVGFMMLVMGATKPVAGELRFSPIETGYLFKEYFAIITILFIALMFIFRSEKLLQFFESSNRKEEYVVLNGTVIGYFHATQQFSLGSLNLPKVNEFVIIRSGKKKILCAAPKFATLFHGVDQFVIGDEIEVWGKNVLYQRSIEKPLEYVSPLYVKVIEKAALRTLE